MEIDAPWANESMIPNVHIALSLFHYGVVLSEAATHVSRIVVMIVVGIVEVSSLITRAVLS